MFLTKGGGNKEFPLASGGFGFRHVHGRVLPHRFNAHTVYSHEYECEDTYLTETTEDGFIVQ